MFDLNQALAAWLTATLTGYSLAIWNIVIPLAGGPGSPLWRWVLVEQGLFLLGVLFAAWWTRMVLGVGRTHRTLSHWGAAAVCACGFSLSWGWYNLTASHAIALGVHPQCGWEWNFFSWGLPFLLAGSLFPGAPFLVTFGVSLAFGALAILALGRLWAGVPGLSRSQRRGVDD